MRKMLKRKNMLVAAAAVAAAPLAAQAAINVTFGYDTTVTYSASSSFTASSTVAISGNGFSVPASDYFKFNVNAAVTGDTNAASGGSFDTANGTLQPANLGLTSFGINFVNGTAISPLVSGSNTSTVTIPASLKYDISAKGTANTLQAGTPSSPISGGYNTGLVTKTAFTSATHGYRLTLGSTAKTDIFTGLIYKAGASAGVSTIVPNIPAAGVAYAFLQSAGSSSQFPTYTSDTVGTNTGDTLTSLPTLTVNVTGGAITGNNIVSLTSTAPTNTAPTAYGATSLGTVTATGTASSYKAGTLVITPTGTGFVNGVLSGTPTVPTEIYALDIESSAGGVTAPTDLAAIAAAMQTALVAQGFAGSTVSLTPPTGNPFPAGPAGTPGYDVFLTINGLTQAQLSSDFLGFDLTEGASFSTDKVAAVALVPEPTSAAFLLVGASSLLMGRRRRNASQTA
jgi:hypothetical protein